MRPRRDLGVPPQGRAIALAVAVVLVGVQAGPVHLQVITSWASQAALSYVMYTQIAAMARDRALPEPNRRFWSKVRLVGVFSMLAPAAPLVMSVMSRGSGHAVPGVAHSLLSAAAVAALVWACLTHRSKTDDGRTQLRRWLDAASTMAAGLGVLWFFEAGSLLSIRVGALNVVTAMVLDAAAMVTVLAFLQPMTSSVRPISRSTGLITVAAVMVGCVAEAALPAALGTPWLRLVLVLRVLCPALAVLAVSNQRRQIVEHARSAGRSRRIYSLAPYAAVVVTYLLMAAALSFANTDGRAWGMFAAASVVTALVVVRQAAAFVDNAGLVRELMTSVERADRLAAELHQQAFYDGLTGLPNRVLFSDRLEHALVARRRTQQAVTVMVIDLDDFKLVNDSYGHAEGDRVLRDAAARLSSCIRGGDTVARLGGDEFAVLLVGADADAAMAVAAHLVEAFQPAFPVHDNVADLGVSVGVSVTSEVAEDATTLLRHADIAMYEAKSAGKRRFAEFQPSMLDRVVNRHDTRRALTRAIVDNELVVHYQPIADSVDGRVRAVEALVRWERPGYGLVPPLGFLDIAEQLGLILDVDLYVLREACGQVQRWNARLDSADRLSLHVNMSAVTLAAPDVVAQVAAALTDSGLPASHLTVELTESALMADPRAMIARMHALKRTGVRLAIDDFGTGYSSLAYLRDLPVDTVKVDKSFVDRILDEEIDRELVRTIVSLAGRLGLETVAEGVESAEQAAVLSSIGCLRMQGFLFSEPMTADELETSREQVARAAGWLRQDVAIEPPAA
ncbi:MAG: hypothetical protein QOJ62_1084 [Actinomycetota bacterium]|nr:hypothetical protein [Actinomycetota bacterium]